MARDREILSEVCPILLLFGNVVTEYDMGQANQGSIYHTKISLA